MKTMLDHALWYLEQGLPVIPVSWDKERKKRKSPLVEEWKKYQSELPTEKDVRNWWGRWPDAGIALLTGHLSGVIVLDEEQDADRDYFGLLDYDETPIVETGSGGRHFWFAYEPFGNRTEFVPRHDFRGDGGYVLVPPSPHESGNAYKWIVPLGITPLARLPDNVRSALQKSKSELGKDIEGLLSGKTLEGSRNESLTAFIGSVLSKYPTKKWETVVYPIVQAYNKEHLSPPLSDHEVKNTFRSIMSREIKKYEAGDKGIKVHKEGDYDPKVWSENDDFFVSFDTENADILLKFEDIDDTKPRDLWAQVTVTSHTPGFKAMSIDGRINTRSLSARSNLARELKTVFGKNEWSLMLAQASMALSSYLENYDESVVLDTVEATETNHLLHPFIQKDAPNILFADGETGKSFLCLRMAASLALGKDFVGFEPSAVGIKTLFVDYEDTPGNAVTRLNMIAKGMNLTSKEAEMLKQHIVYINPGGSPLSRAKKRIKKMIQKHDIGLMIVDSAGMACGMDAATQEAATLYSLALRHIGITSLTISHVTKGEAGENGQDKPFGSVFWHNSMRNSWNARGQAQTPLDALDEVGPTIKHIGLFHKKSNHGPRERRVAVQAMFLNGAYILERGKEAFWKDEDESVLKVYEEIKEAGSDGISAGEIKDKTELTNQQFKTAKNVLVGLGRVEQRGDKKGTRYFIGFSGNR